MDISCPILANEAQRVFAIGIVGGECMFEIVKYDDTFENRWDRFVEKESVNGTFLQSRRFLNYHPHNRFKDVSIMIMQGSSIVAVVPAHVEENEEGRHFLSHRGSTFGGIVLARDKYNITCLEELFPCLEQYFKDEGYKSATLQQSPDIFSERNMDLIDYYLFKNDWKSYSEVCFYVDIRKAPKDLLSVLNGSRRRGYKHSCGNNLSYRKMVSQEEITDFYRILSENLQKFGVKPVHTLNELLEFKEKRLSDVVDFYGVYTEGNRLVAGTMLFYFNRVLHTQYLAQSQNPVDSRLYAMEYLDYNTMLLAREMGYDFFSFGKSTENHGKVLNVGLATFKEGFGCDYCNNKTYYKYF